jgi:hypothetical protein
MRSLAVTALVSVLALLVLTTLWKCPADVITAARLGLFAAASALITQLASSA